MANENEQWAGQAVAIIASAPIAAATGMATYAGSLITGKSTDEANERACGVIDRIVNTAATVGDRAETFLHSDEGKVLTGIGLLTLAKHEALELIGELCEDKPTHEAREPRRQLSDRNN